jgi:hypothetical protein
MEQRYTIYGLMAEFETPKALMSAAEKTRVAGYRKVDAFTPFPMEGLSEAMGLRRSLVPLITLIGGLSGGLTGFGFQYWVNVSSYPLNIGGRPLNSWPAFIPVTFELTILGASLFAVFGMLALNKLPQPYHPVFNVERFSRASTDRFFICIEADDPKFNLADTARFLQTLEATHVTEVREEVHGEGHVAHG